MDRKSSLEKDAEFSSTDVPSKLTFLSLPPEIRQAVYHYLFRDKDGRLMRADVEAVMKVDIKNHTIDQRGFTFSATRCRNSTNLLLVCNQIYSESRPIYLASFCLEISTENLDAPIMMLANFVPTPIRDNLKYLYLRRPFYDMLLDLPSGLHGLFPNLRQLVVSAAGTEYMSCHDINQLSYKKFMETTASNFLWVRDAQQVGERTKMKSFILIDVDEYARCLCSKCRSSKGSLVDNTYTWVLCANNTNIIRYLDMEIHEFAAQDILLGRIKQPKLRTIDDVRRCEHPESKATVQQPNEPAIETIVDTAAVDHITTHVPSTDSSIDSVYPVISDIPAAMNENVTANDRDVTQNTQNTQNRIKTTSVEKRCCEHGLCWSCW